MKENISLTVPDFLSAVQAHDWKPTTGNLFIEKVG
jgi:hypothetical protein